MHNEAGGLAEQIPWLKAGHAARGGIRESDAALEIKADDAFRGGVEEHLITAIGAGSFLFSAPAHSDINAQAEKVNQVFAGIEDRRQSKRQPVAMAVLVSTQDFEGEGFPRC